MWAPAKAPATRMTTTIERVPEAGRRFRHEALFYQGLEGFISGTAPFLRDAIAADEPCLVVVSAPKIDALRQELGPDADRVDFADMRTVGHNPARIIPAWYDFVAERTAGGRYIRGIGEPISPDRSPEALVECQRHESLLNLAFADASAWWLMCPYDTSALDRPVVEEALRSHPYVLEDGTHRSSDSYSDLPDFAKPFDLPLPDPGGSVHSMSFDLRRLEDVRCLVSGFAAAQGLGRDRIDDLMLAVNEVATNSFRHGGGRGDLPRMARGGPDRLRDQRLRSDRPAARRSSASGSGTGRRVRDLARAPAVRPGPAAHVPRRNRRAHARDALEPRYPELGSPLRAERARRSTLRRADVAHRRR